MSDPIYSSLTPQQPFHLVVLCQGQRGDGSPYWAYVQLAPTKAKAFKAAQAAGEAFDLEDFGEILAWGTDADVPADVQQRMEREHRVSHDFEQDLRNAVLAERKKT